MNQNINLAKAFLLDILLFKPFQPWQPAEVLLKTGKQQGFPKAVLKQARKELGIVSMTIGGKQFWAHPQRISLPEAVKYTEDQK